MADEAAQTLDGAWESLSQALIELDALSKRAAKAARSAKKYSIPMASHVAYLATKRGEIVGQLRQLEKHDRLVSKTPEQRFRIVLAYVRELDATKLAELEMAITETKTRRVL